MNCEALQRQLLSSESPERPPADACAHLADCAACREWLQRLLQIENAVPRLPIPPADTARAALVRRILAGDSSEAKSAPAAANGQPARRPSFALVLGTWIMDPRASRRRRVAAGLVAGVAAALLLFLTVWLVQYSNHATPVAFTTERAPGSPLLAEMRRLGVRVPENEPKSPTERVKVMADAAEQLRLAAGNPRVSDAELIALAQLYGRVVDEEVIKTAEGLASTEEKERREVLEPIARDLQQAESEWKRLTQQNGLSSQAKSAIDRAAVAANRGHKRLQELVG
jgi:hypothetical protein